MGLVLHAVIKADEHQALTHTDEYLSRFVHTMYATGIEALPMLQPSARSFEPRTLLKLTMVAPDMSWEYDTENMRLLVSDMNQWFIGNVPPMPELLFFVVTQVY